MSSELGSSRRSSLLRGRDLKQLKRTMSSLGLEESYMSHDLSGSSNRRRRASLDGSSRRRRGSLRSTSLDGSSYFHQPRGGRRRSISSSLNDSSSGRPISNPLSFSRRLRRQDNARNLSSLLGASISDASVRTYQQAQKSWAQKVHKFTYQKAMRPLWKNLQQFRKLTVFTPQQLRQFFYGMALTMHMLTKYNKRGSHLHSKLSSIFMLVFVPFMVPPVVVLFLPTLLFLAPLLIVLTAFSALNRKAKEVQEQNRKRPKLENGTLIGRRLYMSSAALGGLGSSAYHLASDVSRRGADWMSSSIHTLSGSSKHGSTSTRKMMIRGGSLKHKSPEAEAAEQEHPEEDEPESEARSVTSQTTTTNKKKRRSSLLQRRTSFLRASARDDQAKARDLETDSGHGGASEQPSLCSVTTTVSTIGSSWDLELVSSFESATSESNNNEDIDATIVDSTPPVSVVKLPWWNSTSSNDTPTTADTGVSNDSTLGVGRRRNSIMRQRKSNNTNRTLQRRVSFAATTNLR